MHKSGSLRIVGQRTPANYGWDFVLWNEIYSTPLSAGLLPSATHRRRTPSSPAPAGRGRYLSKFTNILVSRFAIIYICINDNAVLRRLGLY